MAELKELTDENYEKEVINSKDIWCVTFSALSFCQPCRMLHPVIESIAKMVNWIFRNLSWRCIWLIWSKVDQLFPNLSTQV